MTDYSDPSTWRFRLLDDVVHWGDDYEEVYPRMTRCGYLTHKKLTEDQVTCIECIALGPIPPPQPDLDWTEYPEPDDDYSRPEDHDDDDES